MFFLGLAILATFALLWLQGGDDNRREIKENERIITLDPSDDVTWSKLGDLYARAGHYADSRKAYESAIKLNPYQPNYQLALAAMLEKSGDITSALEQLNVLERRGYERMDQPGDLVSRKVNYLHRAGAFKDAVEYLKKLPNGERFSELLGDTYSRLRESENALAAYETAKATGKGSSTLSSKIENLHKQLRK